MDTHHAPRITYHASQTRLLYAVLCTLGLCLSLYASGQTQTESLTYDLGVVSSVALSDDALSNVVNPAGLGVPRRTNGFLSIGRREDNHSYINTLLAGSWLSVGYQRAEDEASGASAYRWTTGIGGRLRSGLYAGAAYHTHRRSRGGKLDTVDLGLLFRPRDAVSLGLVARGINQSQGDAPEYELGLGIRPAGHRWTLFADTRWREGQDVEDMAYRYGIRAEIVQGLLLDVARNENRFVHMGLRIQLPHTGIGYARQVDREGKRASEALHLTFQADRSRPFLVRRNALQQLNISGRIVEEPSISLFGGRTRALRPLIQQIEQGQRDPQIAGMILRIEGASMSMGAVEELRAALKRFQEAGKPIVCYLNATANYGFYLASAADRIVVAPAGYVFLTGLRAEVPFYRAFLDKIGIQPEFEKIGRYKSAPEIFERDTMSPFYREQLESIIEDRYSRLVQTIARDRGIPADSMRVIVDRGIIDPVDAQQVGLVDTTGYYEEAVRLAGTLSGLTREHEETSQEVRRVDLSNRTEWRTRWDDPPKIAVIYASGMINTGESGTDPLLGERIMGSETLRRLLRTARTDRSIRAVVLRIDSGGGSSLASDLIWRAAHQTREAGKPLLVSIGNAAASGGYLIACPADTIVANPSAIVGSIGVFAGKLNMAGLYEKLGIKTEVVQRGESAGLFSTAEGFNPRQRELVRRSVQRMYKDFVSKVAAARHMTYGVVDSLGEGRIYTAAQGVENGLVDEIGDLHRTIEIAKTMAGIEGDVQRVFLPRERPFWWPNRADLVPYALQRLTSEQMWMMMEPRIE